MYFLYSWVEGSGLWGFAKVIGLFKCTDRCLSLTSKSEILTPKRPDISLSLSLQAFWVFEVHVLKL